MLEASTSPPDLSLMFEVDLALAKVLDTVGVHGRRLALERRQLVIDTGPAHIDKFGASHAGFKDELLFTAFEDIESYSEFDTMYAAEEALDRSLAHLERMTRYLSSMQLITNDVHILSGFAATTRT